MTSLSTLTYSINQPSNRTSQFPSFTNSKVRGLKNVMITAGVVLLNINVVRVYFFTPVEWTESFSSTTHLCKRLSTRLTKCPSVPRLYTSTCQVLWGSEVSGYVQSMHGNFISGDVTWAIDKNMSTISSARCDPRMYSGTEIRQQIQSSTGLRIQYESASTDKIKNRMRKLLLHVRSKIV